MKKILTAIAMTIALPAAAYSQTTPVPTHKAADHASMMAMMNCKGMAGHKAGSGNDMTAMKTDNMAGMKGHDMGAMTKQDHEKMMLACGKAPATGATTPLAVQPTHKM